MSVDMVRVKEEPRWEDDENEAAAGSTTERNVKLEVNTRGIKIEIELEPELIVPDTVYSNQDMLKQELQNVIHESQMDADGESMVSADPHSSQLLNTSNIKLEPSTLDDDNKTMKPVPRCSELMVSYGNKYARPGVDLGRYHSPQAYTEIVALKSEPEDSKLTENDAENRLKCHVTKDVAHNAEKLQNNEKSRKTALKCEDLQACDKTQEDEKIHKTADPANFKDERLITNESNSNVTENNTYICDHCGKAFNEKAKLIVHITTHNTTKGAKNANVNNSVVCKLSCLTCNCEFATKSELINHNIKVHDSKIKYKACNECDFKTIHNFDLKKHIKSHSGLRPYQCTVCDSIFSDGSYLKTHLRIHTGEKPFECSICRSKFNESGNLKVHMRIHTGEKPYKCTECDSSFNKSNNLKVHLRIHTGEKPYKCSICGSKFNTSNSLKIHTRIHSGEKPYKCMVCDSKFIDRSTLNAHMRVHTGEKPFHCTICDSKFSKSGHLKSHLRIHTGEKPFTCTVCNARFSNGSTYKRHYKIHSGESYNCNVCGSTFSTGYSLRMHKKIHSGGKSTTSTVSMS